MCLFTVLLIMVEPHLFHAFVLFLLSFGQSESVERWLTCGHLEIPAGYNITAGSAGEVVIADTADIKVVLKENGTLFCKCKTGSVTGPINFTLFVPLTSQDEAEGVTIEELEVPLSVTCNSNNLQCVKMRGKSGSHRIPFAVSQASLVAILSGRDLSRPFCDQFNSGVGDVSGAIVRGELEDGTSVILDMEKLSKWMICHSLRKSQLEVRFCAESVSTGLNFCVVQLFAFDADSCVEEPFSVGWGEVLLAVLQTSQESSYGRDSIHAALVNDIHSLRRAVLPVSRVSRSAGVSSDPVTVHATVRENSPMGTVVTTVLYVGVGVATFSFTSFNSIFAIDATSGVITTKSKL